MVSSGLVGAKEAAKFLGISETRINQLRSAGVLSYSTCGGRFVYPIEALKAYAATNLKIGSVA